MSDDYHRSDERVRDVSAPAGHVDPDDPEAIRAEIQRTRDRMGRTVDQLGYRLNPDRLKSRMKQNLHDATVGKAEHMASRAVHRADETRHSIMDTLRDNPLPAAMVGIGLGWLMVNARRDDDEHRDAHDERVFREGGGRIEMGYTALDSDRPGSDDFAAQRYRDGIDEQGTLDRAGDRLSDVSESARDWVEDMTDRTRREVSEASDRAREEAHRAKDGVTEIAHDARDSARDLADRAHERFDSGAERARSMGTEMARRTRLGAGRVEDLLDDVLHDSPLAIGAAAVALGMAVGLSAPSTRRESEIFGSKRDELMSRAREELDEVKGRVRHVAERVADEARSTAREAAREEGLTGDASSRPDDGLGGPTGGQGSRPNDGFGGPTGGQSSRPNDGFGGPTGV
ncbi:MAG TPA: DUF3618 domain-containing protein [Longimicrobiaceae bacterium]|nr:DUF3618 domain-containing protein [Longimicrobiaceae bacterium]